MDRHEFSMLTGELVEGLNRLVPPDEQVCNAPFEDGCGCSLKRFHQGPHEARGPDRQAAPYHTWED